MIGVRRGRRLEHDPEKWIPVSRLREAQQRGRHFRFTLWRTKAGRKGSCSNNNQSEMVIQPNRISL